jgi:hypothetical protein
METFSTLSELLSVAIELEDNSCDEGRFLKPDLAAKDPKPLHNPEIDGKKGEFTLLCQ